MLVVGVYNMHKLAADGDPMVFFYGDGAGAAVLEPADEPGFVSSAMRADGSYHGHWGIYAGATFEPATEEAVREGRTTVKMIERYPPEVNHEGWPKVVTVAGGQRWFRGLGHRLHDLHPGAEALDRARDVGPRSADGADAHGDGEVGLHRIGVRADRVG